MKFTAAALVTLLGYAAAGAPQLSVSSFEKRGMNE